MECYYYHEMGHYQYQCKKLRAELGGFKKSCDSHKFVDAMIGTEYSEDEDSGDVFMVNKGGFNIKRVIYFSCCFHICWNKVWLDMNKACNKGLLHWLIIWNTKL